jgi:uncharacterized protein YlxP (DUF503 family)
MVVKLLTFDLHFPGCSSLKEKRFVLSSLKSRLRQRFNVSVAEVGHQDKWQRCRLAVVMVGSSRRAVDTSCNKVLRFVENDHRLVVADYDEELR